MGEKGFQLLNGTKVAEGLKSFYSKQIIEKKIDAILAVIWVGNDSISMVYVNKKRHYCESIGVKFKLIHLSSDTSEELTDLRKKLESAKSNTTSYCRATRGMMKNSFTMSEIEVTEICK